MDCDQGFADRIAKAVSDLNQSIAEAAYQRLEITIDVEEVANLNMTRIPIVVVECRRKINPTT